MKKLSFLIVSFLLGMCLSAQVPLAFKYQAVARDGIGNVLTNRAVSFRISILQGSASGSTTYSETHSKTTNGFGLVDLEIGHGTPVSGSFTGINWGSDSYIIKVEMDPNGGSSYIILGTSQLLSVPYALLSKRAETGDDWGSQNVITDATLSGNGTVSTPLKINDNGVNSSKIVDASIVGADIANSAITTDKINAGAITGSKISQAGASTGQALKWNGTTWAPATDETGTGNPTGTAGGDLSGTYPNPTIGDSKITSAKIVDGTIATADLANNSVTTDKINAGSVTGAKIAQASASTGQALKWNGTTWAPATDETGTGNPTGPAGGDLSGTYPNPTIGDSKVTSAKIQDATIVNIDLADNAVNSAKILDGTIAAADLATNSVTTDKINAGAVTGAKIAQASATTGQALKWNGTTWAPTDDATGTGLTLPYTATISSAGDAFTISCTSTENTSAINGYSYSGTGPSKGVYGHSNSTGGIGVMGTAGTSTGYTYGIYGMSSSSTGTGVYGLAFASSGVTYGVQGRTNSPTGCGVYGSTDVSSGINYGVYGRSASTSGIGVYGFGKYGLQGESSDEFGYGLNVKCTHTTGITRGVNVSMSSPNGFAGYFSGGNRFVVTTADVGIGLVAPSRRLSIYTESGISSANFINNASGTTSSDGLLIGYSGGTLFGGAVVQNYENEPLYLGTDGQPRITISGSGNVGIGTIFPDWQLVVQAPDNASRPMVVCRNGDGNDRVQLRQTSNGSGAFYLWNAANTNTVFLYGDGNSFINSGNLGIGTTSPAYKLQVGVAGDGTQARANAWNLLSDARLKKDFTPIDDPLGKVQKMNGYYYYWNTGTDQSRQVGFSAQEMKMVLPEVVSQGDDGYLSIEYGKMTPLLIEAIKALKSENEQLKARLEKLESLLPVGSLK